MNNSSLFLSGQKSSDGKAMLIVHHQERSYKNDFKAGL
jgi:hypothetical protein